MMAPGRSGARIQTVRSTNEQQAGPAGVEIDVIIEDPRGSTVRHHLDESSGRWTEKRHPRATEPWPVNYGYIPGTHNPVDNDDLDIMVLSREPLLTGAEVRVRAVGLLERPDGDDKILGVLTDDPDFGSAGQLSEIPGASIRAIEDWFAAWSEVGEWRDADAAIGRILAGRNEAVKLKRYGAGC